MYVNGIVIQENKNKKYKGIDGSGFSPETGQNWYLNYIEGLESFDEYYDEKIGMTYYNLEDRSFVAVCNDWNYINDYIKESIKRGIEYRILLCETEIPQPIMKISSTIQKKFLGYDYAYASGDNYSAVYNEISEIIRKEKIYTDCSDYDNFKKSLTAMNQVLDVHGMRLIVLEDYIYCDCEYTVLRMDKTLAEKVLSAWSSDNFEIYL